MGTLKQRHNKGRTRRRRSHNALGAVKLTKCSKCSTPILPHHMCKVCGNYDGREVVKILSRAEKVKAKHDKHKH